MKHKIITNINSIDIGIKDLIFNENSDLIIMINSHNNVKIEIKFTNTIEFLFNLNAKILYLCELNESSTLLEEALSRKYEIPQIECRFREYQLIDVKNFPSIQIISEEALTRSITYK